MHGIKCIKAPLSRIASCTRIPSTLKERFARASETTSCTTHSTLTVKWENSRGIFLNFGACLLSGRHLDWLCVPLSIINYSYSILMKYLSLSMLQNARVLCVRWLCTVTTTTESAKHTVTHTVQTSDTEKPFRKQPHIVVVLLLPLQLSTEPKPANLWMAHRIVCFCLAHSHSVLISLTKAPVYTISNSERTQKNHSPRKPNDETSNVADRKSHEL